MNISWDGEKYASDFSFVHQYGSSVIELLTEGKGRTVLDLGCGSGALSKVLRDRGYLVQGIDASRELLDIAERTCPGIPFTQADAADFSLKEPVDAVFSNAVFHWIDKDRQTDMLRCVYDALKPGGEFVFEFGGHGNTRLIHNALEAAFAGRGYAYKMPFYFPTIGEYASLLESAGFRTAYAVLFDRPTELKGENGLRDWIALFVKTPFSAVRTQAERAAIIDEAAERLRDMLYQDSKWYADYVRLRMKAIRL